MHLTVQLLRSIALGLQFGAAYPQSAEIQRNVMTVVVILLWVSILLG